MRARDQRPQTNPQPQRPPVRNRPKTSPPPTVVSRDRINSVHTSGAHVHYTRSKEGQKCPAPDASGWLPSLENQPPDATGGIRMAMLSPATDTTTATTATTTVQRHYEISPNSPCKDYKGTDTTRVVHRSGHILRVALIFLIDPTTDTRFERSTTTNKGPQRAR